MKSSHPSRRVCLTIQAVALVLFLSFFGNVVYGQTETGSIAKPRAFQILALGDSIMWGQGLNIEDKFTTKTKNWIANEVLANKSRGVCLRSEAHSGASIFPERETYDSAIQFRHGETNVSNPAILLQVDTARAYYQRFNRPDCTDAFAPGPEFVDLVLVDGCANDFGMFNLANSSVDDRAMAMFATNYCEYGMNILLRSVASSFPKATIVVTGYYPLFSKKTDPNIISRTFFSVFEVKKYFNIPFTKERDWVRKMADRSELWVQFSTRALERAVEKVNSDTLLQQSPTSLGGPRVIFVKPNFRDEHSYGTGSKETFLWALGDGAKPGDPMQQTRIENCKKDGMTGVWEKVCHRAAAFHPNQNGANHYFEQIKAGLLPLIPEGGWK